MRTTLILIVVALSTSLSFSQGGGAYKQLKPINNGTSNSLQYWGKVNAQNKEANRLVNERTKKLNEKRFIKFRDLAIENYNNKKFSKCIEYYNSSLKLGYYDASLELVTGVSYYHFFVQTKKKKFKKRAKKLFKLSKKHGNIDAELLLDKYF
tara:strand:- start:73 stop:528 length:456 start_codon:yes stop_codon:yes gene_type:complete